MLATGRPPSPTLGGSSRFSSTFRLEKMPRSSGQMAMPSLAIAFEGSRMVSVPRSLIDPSRRATIPMIDFSVVVLPAPLRPSSVTTSPSRTSKSMPCRMCDSPYQALSPLTSTTLGMSCSQIRLNHARILRHRVVVALRQDFATLQHGDVIGQRRDHGKVVLNHQ